MSTSKYSRTLPDLPRKTNPQTPTKPKRFTTLSTPKVLKGNALVKRTSLLLQQIKPGKNSQPTENIKQPTERIKQPIEKIKPGLDKEMKHAILLDVPGLIEKRLPDTLFQRLACPQPLIIVVDGSELLPHADSDSDASILVTDDGQDHPCTGDAQDGPNSSTLPEQQHQANEGNATSKADDDHHPQNGGDGKEPVAEDTHVASVSDNSPNVDPHPLSDLSRPSAPPARVSDTESITPFPGVKEIFKHLSDKESEPLDYAEAIRDLYKAGYYHRDISDHNLIIVTDDDYSPSETDSLRTKNDDSPTLTDSLSTENNESSTKSDSTRRIGFLIDLDCATEVVHMRGAKAELTGTLPFMPIEMLENYGCEHKYYFDLESLFYVLVWICLTEDGPRREDHYPKSGYAFQGSALDRWCGGDSIPKQDDNVVFENIGNIKRATMENAMVFHRSILSHLPEYFKPIRTLLKDLRKLLFRPALDDEDDTDTPEDRRPISKRRDVDRVFSGYIEALEKARDRLPASDPVSAPTGGVNGLSKHVDTNDYSVPLTMEDKPERRVRRAVTTKRPTLVEDANGDDDSSVESEPDDKRKDPDYNDLGGYISSTAGKGRQGRTTRSTLSTKRSAPDIGSSAKRRRTASTRAKSSRS
ncbi:hypothetical protein ACEPAH_1998 [Sanghuangporus vaninii]